MNERVLAYAVLGRFVFYSILGAVTGFVTGLVIYAIATSVQLELYQVSYTKFHDMPLVGITIGAMIGALYTVFVPITFDAEPEQPQIPFDE